MRRATEIATLGQILRDATSGLQIVAITGPGGVGKTYLLDEVFALERPHDLGYLQLKVDASNPQIRADFFGLVDGQLAARSLPPPARPDYDYFPQVRRVAAIHREIVESAADELSRRGAPEEVRTAALALLRTAHVLNSAIPKTRTLLDVARLHIDDRCASEVVDAAWEAVVRLRALGSSNVLPGPLRDVLGLTKRNRVKRDLFNFTADALCGDLTAILDGYRSGDALKITHAPLAGFSRLLIVLDDFEATAQVLGDFVVSALLPRLAAAPFPTVMIIASRDHLDAIHPGFAQHARRWLAEPIVLRPFDLAAAVELMEEAKIPPARQEQLFTATHGFPFLLALAIEEASAPDAESALLAKKFFDRTTRWMTDREREWFVALCYLDVVNEDTIRAVLEADDASEVQRWFERESSIRDPVAAVFTIRPLIREKALRYLALRSPSRHRSLKEKALPLNQISAATDEPG